MIRLLPLFFLATVANFLPSDLPGPFLNRLGPEECPAYITFSTTIRDIGPEQISIIDQPCTQGLLTFDTSEDRLTRYLSTQQGAGDTLSILVTQRLVCPFRTFEPSAIFSFVKPQQDIVIDWQRIFGRNAALKGAYTLQTNLEYMIILDRCVYTRLTEQEIAQQTGECFSSNQTVRTPHGITDISTLSKSVWDGFQYTPILGYTHYTPSHIGLFVRVTTAKGAVTLSSGHLLHANNTFVPARKIETGMVVAGGVVVDVRWIVARGLYHIHTVSGFIEVGGVRVTCYTDRFGVGGVHAALMPVRLWGQQLVWAASQR